MGCPTGLISDWLISIMKNIRVWKRPVSVVFKRTIGRIGQLILIKIVQILYCSAIISSKFLLFFWKKNDSFYIHTYALMSQCMRKVPNGNIQSRIKDFVVFYVREYMLRCPNWILSCWFHFCWKCTAASTKTKVSYE